MTSSPSKYDYRRVYVSEALKEREGQLVELKKALADLGLDRDKSENFDDLFLLRFLLSNETVKAAEKNARSTILWRRENAEALKVMRETGKAPHHSVCSLYMCQGMHGSLKDGSPIFIVRAGMTDMPRLLKDVPHENIAQWILFQREEAFAICDKKTRELGYLVKVVSVVDQNNSGAPDRRFFNILSNASKLSEVYYPQLLGTSVLINLPSWFGWVFAVLKNLLPRKLLEKTKFCQGQTLKDSLGKCPYATIMLDESKVPTFLGGSCTCSEKGGCINGVPNDRSTPIGPDVFKRAETTAADGNKDVVETSESDLVDMFVNLTLGHSETKEVKIPVTAAEGGRVGYSVDGDGAYFTITAISSSGSKKVIVPEIKMEGPVSGDAVVEPSTKELVAKFDNHAKLKKKQLKYMIEFVAENDNVD